MGGILYRIQIPSKHVQSLQNLHNPHHPSSPMVPQSFGPIVEEKSTLTFGPARMNRLVYCNVNVFVYILGKIPCFTYQSVCNQVVKVVH